MANSAADTIYVLNGADLGPLGTGEAEGNGTFADVERLCAVAAPKFGLTADCRQSNREDELIAFIREAQANKAAGIILDAGDRLHTSTALQDALMAVRIPTVDVHATNRQAHESLRRHFFAATPAFATLAGFGIEGYRLAISGLAAKLGRTAQA